MSRLGIQQKGDKYIYSSSFPPICELNLQCGCILQIIYKLAELSIVLYVGKGFAKLAKLKQIFTETEEDTKPQLPPPLNQVLPSKGSVCEKFKGYM